MDNGVKLIFGLVSLLVGFIVMAALLPNIFGSISDVRQSYEGYCQASANANIRWAVGESLHSGGYWTIPPTAPPVTTVCARNLTTITLTTGTWNPQTAYGQGGTASGTITWVPVATTNDPYNAVITTILQLAPLAIVLGLAGALIGVIVVNVQKGYKKAKSSF